MRQVEITKNSTMVLTSNPDVYRASHWLSDLLQDFARTNGLKVHDGMTDFSSLPSPVKVGPTDR